MTKPLKVLILEDLKTDRELIKRQVKKMAPNAIFTVATSGKEFKEKIGWGVPDIILSDYNLPDYNGVEALLLAKEKVPHIPFVFITGMLNNEEAVAKAVLSGASDYILKENLREIPTRLAAVIDAAAEHQAAEEKRRTKNRKRELLLQKMSELLKNTDDFPNKRAIEEVLAEIQR